VSILALCPSRRRPQQAAETLASFLETRRDPRSRLLFIVDADDETAEEYPAGYTTIVPPRGCMGGAMQEALTVVLGDATSVGMIGDDNRFRTPGWDLVLDDWLTENVGVAYGDDGFQHERLPTSWWLSRKIVDAYGMAHPFLRHLYMDNYWQTMGQGARCIRYFPEVYIEHLHPLAGKAPSDAIYERGNSPSNIGHDRSFFEWWRKYQAEDDVAELRRLVGYTKQGINVLADYHHAALFESLALLFEDRFGWRLFRPVGPEWKAEGYWDFINLDMKLDWTDLLAIGQIGQPDDGFYRLENRQYPERPMKGVTLYQARAMDWDFVLASVWKNQNGFARFADESHATFLHQIGNAHHSINRRLQAKFLISAQMDLVGHPNVIYHQEFSLDRFRYEPPGPSRVIANFQPRFDWQKPQYAMFVEAQRLAPDLDWVDHGTLYGDLERQDDVADAMRATAFIWHDKSIGDGYGHLIHNAAAVGRPIIGHSSFYRGRMASIFWRDLETCIDLDRHTIPEAVALVREILADPDRHRMMCEAMAQTFRENIDFSADAENVRDLLLGGIHSADLRSP